MRVPTTLCLAALADEGTYFTQHHWKRRVLARLSVAALGEECTSLSLAELTAEGTLLKLAALADKGTSLR